MAVDPRFSDEPTQPAGQELRTSLWSISATIDLMRQASLLRDPQELIRLLGRHVSDSLPVDRAIVVTRTGMEYPRFSILHALRWNERTRELEEDSPTIEREGGLLAELLYRGEVAIVHAGASTTDPNADLLQNQRTVLSLPQFVAGEASQMIFLLCPEPAVARLPDLVELAGLALAANLIERISEENRLASRLDAAHRALDWELAKAGEMQRMLLPTMFAAFPGVASAVSYRTAAYAGGDYYCVSELADGRILLLIADVSGHGAPAAVIAGVIATTIQIQQCNWSEPAQVLSDLNRQLCLIRIADAGVFVTALCGILDPRSGELGYSSAGHPAPRITPLSAGPPRTLDGASALPLGIATDTLYTQRTTALTPGDAVLLFTDGITEASSPLGEFFGERGLDRVLTRFSPGGQVLSMVQAINDELADFTQNLAPVDDQTIVAVMYEGDPSVVTPAIAQEPPSDYRRLSP